MEKPTVICDKCKRNIKINLKTKKKGEIEYKYFCCKRCGTVYVSSATDAELRKDIEKYQSILAEYQGKDIPQEVRWQAQELLKSNVKRSKELKEKYPFELKA